MEVHRYQDSVSDPVMSMRCGMYDSASELLAASDLLPSLLAIQGLPLPRLLLLAAFIAAD